MIVPLLALDLDGHAEGLPVFNTVRDAALAVGRMLAWRRRR